MPRPITVGNVQHGRADRLPNSATPACFEGAMHLHSGIRRRRRSQPERIRRSYPRKIYPQISHAPPAFHGSLAPPTYRPPPPSPWMRLHSTECSRPPRKLRANWSGTLRPPEYSPFVFSDSAAWPAKPSPVQSLSQPDQPQLRSAILTPAAARGGPTGLSAPNSFVRPRHLPHFPFQHESPPVAPETQTAHPLS